MKKLISAILALCLACSMGCLRVAAPLLKAPPAPLKAPRQRKVPLWRRAAARLKRAAPPRTALPASEESAEAAVMSYDEYMAAAIDDAVTIQAYVQASNPITPSRVLPRFTCRIRTAVTLPMT